MGYAFENTPWHEIPDSEKLAIWKMQAIIRDDQLNPSEAWMKQHTLREFEARNPDHCPTCLSWNRPKDENPI